MGKNKEEMLFQPNEELVFENENHKKKLEENKKEKVVFENKKGKEKKEKKEKNKTFQKFFFGVGKEFKRISWLPKKNLFSNLLVVLVLVIIFAAIFTGISIAMINFL